MTRPTAKLPLSFAFCCAFFVGAIANLDTMFAQQTATAIQNTSPMRSSSETSADESDRGRKIALLVGVRAYYPDRFQPLPGAETDMTELAKVLFRSGFQQQNIHLLTNSKGSSDPRLLPLSQNIRKQLKNLAKDCQPNDTVVIALAGHGIQPRGKNYLFCPFDADLEEEDTLISLDEIYGYLEKCPAKFKLLMMDACREDTLAGDDKNVSTAMPNLPTPPKGTAVFVSCSAGQLAFERDDAEKTHGVFFHAVIRGLKGEAAGDDGQVTLPDLERFVKKDVQDYVQKTYNAEQFPVIRNNTVGLHPIAQYSVNDEQMEKIRWLVQRDRYDEAMVMVDALLKKNSKDGIALSEKARIITYKAEQEADDSRMDEAMKHAEHSIKLAPTEAMPYVALANVHRMQKNYELSLTASAKALERDPNNVLAHIIRGMAFYQQKKYKEMLEEAQIAIEIDPEHPEARGLYAAFLFADERMEEGHAELDRAIALTPDIATLYFLKGYGYEQQGEHNKAILQYSSAIRLNSKVPSYYVRRALSLGNGGDYPAAWKDVEAAEKLAPNYFDVTSARAMLLVNQQKWQEALVALNKGLKINPDNRDLLMGRGFANIYTKNFDAAEADLQHMLRVDLEAAQGHLGLGIVDLYRNRMDDALTHMNRAIRYNDRLSEAHYVMAAIYMKKQDFKKAIPPLSRAIELNDKNAQWYQQRAMLLSAVGRSAEAQRDMQKYQQLQNAAE